MIERFRHFIINTFLSAVEQNHCFSGLFVQLDHIIATLKKNPAVPAIAWKIRKITTDFSFSRESPKRCWSCMSVARTHDFLLNGTMGIPK